jgi:hypothetical protein
VSTWRSRTKVRGEIIPWTAPIRSGANNVRTPVRSAMDGT